MKRFGIFGLVTVMLLASVNVDAEGLGTDTQEVTTSGNPFWKNWFVQAGLDMSLQKIYGNLFGGKISKSQQLSNWEADQLTIPQQHYAAIDAWACLQIYRLLQELKQYLHNAYIMNPAADFQRSTVAKITSLPFDLITLLLKGR